MQPKFIKFILESVSSLTTNLIWQIIPDINYPRCKWILL